MKILKGLIKFILASYILMCVGLWFGQEKVLFRPSKLSEDYIFHKKNEVEIEVAEEVFLNGLWLRTENAKGAILYLHGNRGSIKRCQHQARSMTNNGYDVLIIDYRGYGKSDGKISNEQQLHTDLQKVYDYIKDDYQEDQIIIVGYSLGSGMASHLASNNSPQQLVLIAPYLNFYQIKNDYIPIYLPDFLVRFPLDNLSHLKSVECPTTLFHGTLDEVIPYEHSVQLAKLVTEKVELVTLHKESHRGAMFNRQFQQKFADLVK